MVSTYLLEVGLKLGSSFIDSLIKNDSNPLDRFDATFLKELLSERTTELLFTFIEDGITGVFKILEDEAAKTSNTLDDVKVEAIKKAVVYSTGEIKDWLTK